jgi:hypothetical protein
VYSKTYTAVNGCDSTIAVTLNVTSINKKITRILGALTSNEASATYKWLDCGNANVIIPNETVISYSPTATGSYAVELTKNNCIDTSFCEPVLITSIEKTAVVVINRVYPNPVSSIINLHVSTDGIHDIKVVSSTGAVVMQQSSSATNVSLDVGNLATGMYVINRSQRKLGS